MVKINQTASAVEIILNRPECGNLMTMEMIGQIAATLRNLPEQTRLVILRGAGSDFCKGRDYAHAPEESQRRAAQPTAEQIRDRMTTPILEMYGLIKELSVPTLSVAQGVAAGFGCALCCACDIVIAGRSARFGLPELRERGLPPTLAMTALLDRVDYRTLSYLVYSTDFLSAESALSGGLISAVFEDETVEARSKEIINTIASIPIGSLKAVKAYLKVAPSMPPKGRAELGANLFAVAAASR